jgi:hypothetical protein
MERRAADAMVEETVSATMVIKTLRTGVIETLKKCTFRKYRSALHGVSFFCMCLLFPDSPMPQGPA